MMCWQCDLLQDHVSSRQVATLSFAEIWSDTKNCNDNDTIGFVCESSKGEIEWKL